MTPREVQDLKRVGAIVGAFLTILTFIVVVVNWYDGPNLTVDGSQLYVAQTPEQHRIGLSKFDRLQENAGMLFIFDKSAIQCMWNRDVGFPVSVAFLDEAGDRILNLETMPAHSQLPVCSLGLSKYALEMNQGWFDKNWKGRR